MSNPIVNKFGLTFPIPVGIEERIHQMRALLSPLMPMTIVHWYRNEELNHLLGGRHDDPHLRGEAVTLRGGTPLYHSLCKLKVYDTVTRNSNYTVTITCRFGERAERWPNRRMAL